MIGVLPAPPDPQTTTCALSLLPPARIGVSKGRILGLRKGICCCGHPSGPAGSARCYERQLAMLPAADGVASSSNPHCYERQLVMLPAASGVSASGRWDCSWRKPAMLPSATRVASIGRGLLAAAAFGAMRSKWIN
jgi:hypothetical protein